MIAIKTHTKEDIFDLNGSVSSSIFEIQKNEGLSFKEDIKYEFHVQKTSLDIIITGKVSTIVTYECVRCLNYFEDEIIVNNLVFSYQLNEEGDLIDLTPDICEEFLLRLSIMPICNEQCKGLCPVCGKDLNKRLCKCSEKKAPSPFDLLDNFNID